MVEQQKLEYAKVPFQADLSALFRAERFFFVRPSFSAVSEQQKCVASPALAHSDLTKMKT